MKYERAERLDIGRRIYEGELSRYEAAERYRIDVNTARDYMRLYRDANSLPAKSCTRGRKSRGPSSKSPESLEELQEMSKEELIDALIMARINEARLKKGYMVKGDGADKEYVLLDNENI